MEARFLRVPPACSPFGFEFLEKWSEAVRSHLVEWTATGSPLPADYLNGS